MNRHQQKSLELRVVEQKYLYTRNLVKFLLTGKDSDAGRDWEQEEKGMTENEMAGWKHQLNGHEFE